MRTMTLRPLVPGDRFTEPRALPTDRGRAN